MPNPYRVAKSARRAESTPALESEACLDLRTALEAQPSKPWPILRSMPSIMVVAFCILAFIIPAAQAATLTVGSGINCDYATLEAAIDGAASGDTLQIADPPGQVAQRIIVKNLTLRGGYSSSCNGTDSLAARSTLLPTEGARMWSVANAIFTLERLELREASSSVDGGIVFVTGASSTLVTIDVDFASNSARDGGAIFLTNGAELYSFDTDFTANNASSNGGAIYCQDSVAQLYGAKARFNDAVDKGGVVYAHTCDLDLFTSSLSGRSTDFTNNSGTSGAVIYAQDGTVEVSSLDGSRILMDANSAGNAGGVFYIAGTATLDVSGVWASNNDANYGGVLSSTSTDVSRFGLRDASCALVKPCNVFENNLAWFGTVFGVSEGVHVRSAMATGNDATTYGSFYLGSGNESHGLLLESSVIAETPVGSLGALIDTNGPLQLRSVSILDNSQSGPAISQNDGAPVAITQSILWNSGDNYESEQGFPPSSVEIDCNVVQNSWTLPAGHTETVVLYPDYVLIPDIAEYRLNAGSVAIDLCSDASVAPPVDLDHNPRPSGPRFDAGAWEDPGFLDGFESGTTSQWSSTTG